MLRSIHRLLRRATVPVAICWLLTVVSVTDAAAAESQKKSAAKEVGLEIGKKAPAFKIKDQHGKKQALEQLLKKGELTAIVFYRSADW